MSESNNITLSSQLDLNAPSNADRSLTQINEVYSILYKDRRDQVLGWLKQAPGFVDLARQLTEGKRYRVILPEGGRLGVRADGTGFTANVHRKDGTFAGQATLQEIGPDLTATVSQLANQQAFAEILQRLELIDQKLNEVLTLGHLDRLAEVNTGISVYHQAVLATPVNQPFLLGHAINDLQKGLELLTNELRHEIAYIEKLPRSYWRMVFSIQSPHRRVDQKWPIIQETYLAILRAAYFLPIAHEHMGNPKSQQFCLQQLRDLGQEFGAAVEKVTPWLSEADVEKVQETWTSAKQIASGITSPSKQLGSGLPSEEIEFEFTPTEITYMR